MNATLRKWLVGDPSAMRQRLGRGFWRFCLVWGCGFVGGVCALFYVFGHLLRLSAFEEMGWREVSWMVFYWVGPAGFCVGALMFAVGKLSLRVSGGPDGPKMNSRLLPPVSGGNESKAEGE